jgi:DNA-binding NarL/FixJ family response regulator
MITCKNLKLEKRQMDIILVDDHKLFRIGLREIIRKSKRHRVTIDFESASQMLSSYTGSNEQLVLVDINLSSENGLDFIQAFKLTYPHLKVAVISMHKEPDIIRKAVSLGVVGYFNKDIDAQELYFGLTKIHEGGRYFTSEVTDILLESHKDASEGRKLPQLSEKEKQVLQFLADGYTSKEIAERLKISKRTVDAHRSHILEKFKFKSTPLLIRHIVENKLL